MKKRMTRLLAMLLCVLSIAALLPTTALAANVKADAVKEAVAEAANTIKYAGEAKLQANGRTWGTKTVKVKYGTKVTLSVPSTYYDGYGRVVPVKFQWQFKKKGSSKYTKLKGSTYYYNFKMSSKKVGVFRCKVINKRNSGDYLYWVFKVKKG